MEEQYIISQSILDDFIGTNPSSCDVPTLNSLLSYVIAKGLVAGGRGEEVAIDLVKSFDAMAIGPADDAPPLPVPHSSSTSFPNSPPLKTFNLPSNTIPALPSPRLMKGKTISSPMRAKMTNRVPRSPQLIHNATKTPSTPEDALNGFVLSGQKVGKATPSSLSPKKTRRRQSKGEGGDVHTSQDDINMGAAAAMAVEGLKLPDGSEPELKEVLVLTTEEISSSSDPEGEVRDMLRNIGVGEWISLNTAVESFRKLALFHPDYLLEHLSVVLPVLRSQVENLRSAITKNALYAFVESFSQPPLGRAIMQLDLQLTLNVIMAKAVGDKKFLSALATRALEAAVDASSDDHVVITLMQYSNDKNARMQHTGASLLDRCVRNILDKSPEEVLSMLGSCLVKPVFEGFYNYLDSRLSSARNNAKNAMILLSSNLPNKKFETAALEVLPEKYVAKLVREIKAAYASHGNSNADSKQAAFERKKAMSRIRAVKRKQSQSSGTSLEEGDVIVVEPGTGKGREKAKVEIVSGASNVKALSVSPKKRSMASPSPGKKASKGEKVNPDLIGDKLISSDAVASSDRDESDRIGTSDKV